MGQIFDSNTITPVNLGRKSESLSGNIQFSNIPTTEFTMFRDVDGQLYPVKAGDINSFMVAKYGPNWPLEWTIDVIVETGKTLISAIQVAPGAKPLTVIGFGLLKNESKALLQTFGDVAKDPYAFSAADVGKKLKSNSIKELADITSYKGINHHFGKQSNIFQQGAATLSETGYNINDFFGRASNPLGYLRSEWTGTGKYSKLGTIKTKQYLGDNTYFYDPTLKLASPGGQSVKYVTYSLLGKTKPYESPREDAFNYKTKNWVMSDWQSYQRLTKEYGYSSEQAIDEILAANARDGGPGWSARVISYSYNLETEIQEEFVSKKLMDQGFDVAGELFNISSNEYKKSINKFKNGQILEGLDLALSGTTSGLTGTAIGGVTALGPGLVVSLGMGWASVSRWGAKLPTKVREATEALRDAILPEYQPHVFVKRKPDGSYEIIGVDYEDDDLRVELGYAKNIKDVTANVSEQDQQAITDALNAYGGSKIKMISGVSLIKNTQPSWANIPTPQENIQENVVEENANSVQTLPEVVISATKRSGPTIREGKDGRTWVYNNKGVPVAFVEDGEAWAYLEKVGVAYQDITTNGKPDRVFGGLSDFIRVSASGINLSENSLKNQKEINFAKKLAASKNYKNNIKRGK